MRSLRLILLVILLAAAASVSIAALADAQARPSSRSHPVDTTIARDLAPGVTFRQFVDPRGPFVVDVVRVDLRRPEIELRHVRAHDALRGRERPSDMARRITNDRVSVIAAVNADFFDLASGENENNQVVDGEWWKGLKVTDSPFDTYDNVHVQFAVDANRRPLIERFILDAAAWAPNGTTTPIITVNHIPSGRYEGTALYTSRFGMSTPRDTSRGTVEAPLAAAGHRGDTLLFVRRGAVSNASGSAIAPGGAVLAAYGPGLRSDEVRAMADGDTIRVLLTTLPRLPGGGAPALVVGGWPRIIRDGQLVAADAPTTEGTISRNAEMRHGRTAVGYSRDGNTLILLVVDGRSMRSVGMTLAELAATMRSLGAWDAMNFDGGGSTTMVVDGAVANVPSDSTGERAVGSALLVLRKR
jgi:phosphodiester glycosidase